jgi:cytochrome c-type biogenesis protein CcmH
MNGAFVLIAGTLATGTAVLVLLPLLKRRADSKPAATATALVLILVVLLGTAGLYRAFSSYDWHNAEGVAIADTPAAMAAKLAAQLAANPDNLNGWLMLGRSYGVLEQYPLAVRAYQRADRIANGGSSEALLGIAENLVAQDPEQIRGAAGHLFERALAVDPGNAKALFYSAFAAMSRGETAAARERFTRMLALNPPANIRTIIEQRIAALDMTGGAQPAPEASAATAADDQARVAVHVTLSPQLKAKVPPGSVLFVAARDPKSPGPPFAVKRLAAQFPQDVELTAANAMLPSRRIASGQSLEVIARVALGGTPTATSGDPFGQVSYHVGKDGRLNIVIDRLSP